MRGEVWDTSGRHWALRGRAVLFKGCDVICGQIVSPADAELLEGITTAEYISMDRRWKVEGSRSGRCSSRKATFPKAPFCNHYTGGCRELTITLTPP